MPIVLFAPCRISGQEFVKLIGEVKPEDIKSLVKKLLKSPVSVAAEGNVTNIPRYDELKGLFKA